MPLPEARALVRGATEFRKGEGQMVGGTFVLESERLWAALLQGDPGFLAYHALRLIAVRAKERSGAWVFERLEGSDADSLRVRRFLINAYKGRGHVFAYPPFETSDDDYEPRAPEAIDGITVFGPSGDLELEGGWSSSSTSDPRGSPRSVCDRRGSR